MSIIHKPTIKSERFAKRFHVLCFAVGGLHIAAGILMMIWHGRGYQDHENNIKELQRKGDVAER